MLSAYTREIVGSQTMTDIRGISIKRTGNENCNQLLPVELS